MAGFISGPLAPKSGSVYKGMMHISDWYPTIMALAGMKPPQNITLDGFNQWPAISGLSASPRTVRNNNNISHKLGNHFLRFNS